MLVRAIFGVALLGGCGGPQSYCCTGTLIAPTLVVTAGHCHGCVQNGRVFFGRNITGASTTVKTEG